MQTWYERRAGRCACLSEDDATVYTSIHMASRLISVPWHACVHTSIHLCTRRASAYASHTSAYTSVHMSLLTHVHMSTYLWMRMSVYTDTCTPIHSDVHTYDYHRIELILMDLRVSPNISCRCVLALKLCRRGLEIQIRRPFAFHAARELLFTDMVDMCIDKPLASPCLQTCV